MNPSPRIVSFEPVRRASGRVHVVLDDDTRIDTTLDFVNARNLTVGDPVDAHLRARIEEAGLAARTRAAALDLLSYRPRSRHELAGRLRKKDLPGSLIHRCLERLEEEGLLDDAAFARALVRDRMRLKPRARNALIVELKRRGIPDSMARAAVDEVLSEEEIREPELAKEVALGWLRRQGPSRVEDLLSAPFSDANRRARRRLHAYLARRGFRGSILVDAIEATVAAARRGRRA